MRSKCRHMVVFITPRQGDDGVKKATTASLERDLSQFFRTSGSERYILEKDIDVITYQTLHTYQNVYCHSEINAFGRKVYSINSARAHKKLIEVYVRDTIPTELP